MIEEKKRGKANRKENKKEGNWKEIKEESEGQINKKMFKREE